jgi:hypothetical protein
MLEEQIFNFLEVQTWLFWFAIIIIVLAILTVFYIKRQVVGLEKNMANLEIVMYSFLPFAPAQTQIHRKDESNKKEERRLKIEDFKHI